MQPADFTLICPRNDLESETIWNIAQAYSIQSISAGSKWGVRLGDLNLSSLVLKDTIVIIETPGETETKWLESINKRVIHIDHHQYSDSSDTQHSKSSIEQFSELIGHTLSEFEYCVAINDRLFIPGLLHECNCSFQQMCEIRALEAKVRNVYPLREKAFLHKNAFYTKSENGFAIYHCPRKYSDVFSEVAQFPSEQEYNRVKNSETVEQLQLPNVMIFYQDSENNISEISICVNKSKITKLTMLFNELSTQPEYICWFADNIKSAFFGTKLDLVSKEKKRTLVSTVDQLLLG